MQRGPLAVLSWDLSRPDRGWLARRSHHLDITLGTAPFATRYGDFVSGYVSS